MIPRHSIIFYYIHRENLAVDSRVSFGGAVREILCGAIRAFVLHVECRIVGVVLIDCGATSEIDVFIYCGAASRCYDRLGTGP